MAEKDTVSLLRECREGAVMALSGIDEIRGKVCSAELKNILQLSCLEHRKILDKIQARLAADCCCDSGDEPGIVAKGMSWMKINLKMFADNPDKAAADLISDGCSMGIKCIKRYMNRCRLASDDARGIAELLIEAEEKLLSDIGPYL